MNKNMKSQKYLLGLSLAALSLATSASAAVVVSSTTPTVDGADVALITTTDLNSSGTKIYTDANNNFGQSFTTGSNVAGYTITGFSFQVRTASSAPPGTKTFSIRVGGIDGLDFTTLSNEIGHVQSGAWAEEDWWTFTFDTPVTLAADTLYGVDGEMTAASASYTTGIPYFRFASGSQYADGSKYSRADGDPAVISSTSGTNDSVFHVNMTAVPEPSAALLGALGFLALLRRRR
jgi:hypothetical protein